MRKFVVDEIILGDCHQCFFYSRNEYKDRSHEPLSTMHEAKEIDEGRSLPFDFYTRYRHTIKCHILLVGAFWKPFLMTSSFRRYFNILFLPPALCNEYLLKETKT